MTGLSCWLFVVAVADLFRARRDVSSGRRLAVLAGLGAALVVAAAVSAHPRGGGGWVAWLLAAALLAAWILASGAALADRGRRAALLAYCSFGAAVALLALVGTRTGQFGWLHQLLSTSALHTRSTSRVAAVLAALAVQVSTANILIRMLLDLVGVPAQDNEKSLRGGRVLGPMERLMIVGLGLAGNLTGASVVVAAKALLRFPELRPVGPGRPPGGASDVTEYFLIGSFASWIVAFGSLALASA